MGVSESRPLHSPGVWKSRSFMGPRTLRPPDPGGKTLCTPTWIGLRVPSTSSTSQTVEGHEPRVGRSDKRRDPGSSSGLPSRECAQGVSGTGSWGVQRWRYRGPFTDRLPVEDDLPRAVLSRESTPTPLRPRKGPRGRCRTSLGGRCMGVSPRPSCQVGVRTTSRLTPTPSLWCQGWDPVRGSSRHLKVCT